MVKDTTKQLYADIVKEFILLSTKKEEGIPVYSKEFIMNRLAKQFYRSPRTIENIVFNRVSQ